MHATSTAQVISLVGWPKLVKFFFFLFFFTALRRSVRGEACKGSERELESKPTELYSKAALYEQMLQAVILLEPSPSVALEAEPEASSKDA